jgi:predicted deacylase
MEPVRLKSRTFGGHSPGPRLLITGGVHGDEFEPVLAIRRLAGLPVLEHIRGQLTLVPAVNEAALAGGGSRLAPDGLDLARTCPGRAEGSITERTAHALSQLIRSADFYIDLHTGGSALLVWPLAGYMLHSNSAVLDRQRSLARAFNLPVIWGTDSRLEGRSLSVARDANVPAIYAEYLGGGRLSQEGVDAYVDGCLNVMAALKMIDRSPPPSRVQHMVEDPRPGAGHMQRGYPSPSDGCFEPEVQLGQSIESGRPLGRVIDVLADKSHQVLTEQSGLVLVLRALAPVKKGDSLAVILELPTT